MKSQEYKMTLFVSLFLISSLVSGGASAVLGVGLIYEIMFAVHKITSIIMVILFILLIRIHGKIHGNVQGKNE